MYKNLTETITSIASAKNLNEDRKEILQPLIDYIQQKINQKESVNIQFICTHNSRRSHLAQVWAQVFAEYFQIPKVNCFSGGTETTALFPKIVETLTEQGFSITKISKDENPVYVIKFDENALPIIGFSKLYDHAFNPASNFAAVMTCSEADGGCPFIAGAEKRIPITYEDPKIANNTSSQTELYAKRSLEIATEMFYVFSKINRY